MCHFTNKKKCLVSFTGRKKKPRFESEVLEGFHQQKCVRTVQYIDTLGFKRVETDVSVCWTICKQGTKQLRPEHK